MDSTAKPDEGKKPNGAGASETKPDEGKKPPMGAGKGVEKGKDKPQPPEDKERYRWR